MVSRMAELGNTGSKAPKKDIEKKEVSQLAPQNIPDPPVDRESGGFDFSEWNDKTRIGQMEDELTADFNEQASYLAEDVQKIHEPGFDGDLHRLWLQLRSTWTAFQCCAAADFEGFGNKDEQFLRIAGLFDQIEARISSLTEQQKKAEQFERLQRCIKGILDAKGEFEKVGNSVFLYHRDFVIKGAPGLK